MENRRIAIVANSTWNIYNFRLNIIKKLIDKGNTVIVIAPLDEYISYKERFPSVKHISLKSLSRKNTNPLLDFKVFLELRTIYKRLKPDLVIHYTHKPNIYGGLAAKLTGLKSVAVVTGLGYAFIRKGFVNLLTRMLYKLSRSSHELIIFENDDDLNLFVDKGLANKKQVKMISGCGVDTAIYLPNPNGVIHDKLVFTFIGRLLYDKGISEFVKAASMVIKEFPETEFWVAGELDEGNPSMISKQELLDWIDADQIKYLGFLKDIRPIISKSDCIVLPSYREGMSRVILEAMSMSKPVICTNVAGCRQAVEDGSNGILVEPRDELSLKEGIVKFINLNEEKREAMGRNGREKAIEQFNSEKISQELYEILSQV